LSSALCYTEATANHHPYPSFAAVRLGFEDNIAVRC
jgi:hypothetical protein